MKNQLKPNLNDADISAIAEVMGGLLDKQTAILATKEELREGLAAQTVELKAYIHEGVETVMTGMDGLSDRIDNLEKDVKHIKLSHARH